MKKVLIIAVLVLSFLLPEKVLAASAQSVGNILLITPTLYFSATPTPAAYNTPIKLNAKVMVSGGVMPTGTITFMEGSTPLGTATLTASGTSAIASITKSNFLPGTHNLTAVYPGDTNFSSTSTDASLTIQKVQSMLLTPTVDSYPSVVGQSVTVNVSARPATGTTRRPTGIVTVTSDGQTCEAVLTNGDGSCKITYTSSGTKILTLEYPGDDLYDSSSNTGTSQLVNPAATTTIIESVSPDVVHVGQQITVNVQLLATAPGSGFPTGDISVNRDAGESCVVSTFDANGRGSCTFTALKASEMPIRAQYTGSIDYHTSDAYLPLIVSPAITTTTITTPTPGSVALNQSIQVYFTVQPSDPGPTIPTGSVTVKMDGTAACGPVTLPASGSSSCSFTPTSAGSKNLTAEYNGDGNFYKSTSSNYQLKVNKIGNTVSIETISPNPAILNTAVQVTFQVTPDQQLGTPTGTVTILDGSTEFCSATVAAGSCSNAFSTPGVKFLTARYSGDAVYQENTLSESKSLTVNGVDTYADADPVRACEGNTPCFPTIQQAIEAASTGYSATIYDGDYPESVSLEKAITVHVIGDIRIRGSLAIHAGTWNSSTGLMTIEGDFLQTGGTFNASSGTLEMAGISDQQLAAQDALNNLEINSLGNSVTLGAPLNINGSLILTSGALDVSTGNHAIYLVGNWQNNGGSFNTRQGTVTLDGAEQLISGANTFHNLTRLTPGTLAFSAGELQTITGKLDLQGTGDTPLRLRSSANGVQWQFDPQSDRVLSYLDVKDSANINALRIDASGAGFTNTGNNAGWDFHVPAMSTLFENVTEDQETVLTLAASDGDNDPLTLTVVTGPSYGKLYQYDNGRGAEITALPAQITDAQHRLVYVFSQDGPDQDLFDVKISDGLLEHTVTFTLNRTMINDAPTITVTDRLEMFEDETPGPISFFVSDEETAPGDLMVSVSSADQNLVPQSGLMMGGSGGDRTLSISPAKDQNGTTTITLSVKDTGSDPVTVDILLMVKPVNDAPDSGDNSVRLDEDSSYTFAPSDFPFTDPADGDSFAGIRITQTVLHGTLEADTVIVKAGDVIEDVTKVAFTPSADACGDAYATFQFQVRDSAGSFSPEFTMTLNVTPLNDTPTAATDTFDAAEDEELSVPLDKSVLKNDSDVDGDLLTALLVTSPTKGILTFHEDGTFIYKPNANENGDDSFTYQAFDGKALSGIVTVTIQIAPVDDLPQLKLSAFPTVTEGETVILTATYIDPDTNQSAPTEGLNITWEFNTETSDSSSLTASHTFADDGSYTITVRVKDNQGTELSTDTATLAVQNVAPQVDAGADGESVIDQVFSRSGSFTDPGADTWIATVDYGDGSGEQPLALNGKNFVLNHIYIQPGIFTVTVMVKDDELAGDAVTFQVVVANQHKIFIPNICR